MIEREGEKERAARCETNSAESSPGDAQFAGGGGGTRFRVELLRMMNFL